MSIDLPRRFASERRVLADPETGVTIWQMTDAPAVHHHLYFTNPSITPNGRTLLFVSHRSGAPNLFTASLPDGEIAQITDVEDLNPFSAVPARDNARVFYTAGEEIRTVYLETGEEEVLAGFPDARLGNCTLSADGGWVATCVRRDERNAIVAVHTGGATGSGATTVLETTREVGHVQFAPSTDNALLYSGDIRHRVWTVRFDGTEDQWLYPQGPDEWITHETWLGADEVLFVQWPRALMAMSRDGVQARVVAAFNAWHPCARRDGSLIVCDTTLPDRGLQLIDPATGERRTLCHPRSSNRGRQWREPLPTEAGPTDPASAGAAEDPYGPQWTHPHPSFSPDGSCVVYTSDVTGHSQVYIAHL
jgi:oligogalacturonide lyase